MDQKMNGPELQIASPVERASLHLSDAEAALALHALNQYSSWKGDEVSENTLALINKIGDYLYSV